MEEDRSNIMPIVTDKMKLRKDSKPVTEEDDVEGLRDLLFENLIEHEGIGLSAIQLGIPKRACVINVKEPIFLVNPEIVEREGELEYVEGCLSFPNTTVATERNMEVLVEADNHEGQLHFHPDEDAEDLDDRGLLECVVAQHEIDHVNGVLMFDRRIQKNEPYELDQMDIGRNDRVLIEDEEDEVKKVKYKHVSSEIKDGDYDLLEVLE